MIMETLEICWLKIYDWLSNDIVPVIMSPVSFVGQPLGSSLKFTAGPQCSKRYASSRPPLSSSVAVTRAQLGPIKENEDALEGRPGVFNWRGVSQTPLLERRVIISSCLSHQWLYPLFLPLSDALIKDLTVFFPFLSAIFS